MDYTFQKKSTKAWSWTRMKVVKQHFWICTVHIFGEDKTVSYSGELVHNDEDRDKALINFIKGIRAGSFKIMEDPDNISIDKAEK